MSEATCNILTAKAQEKVLQRTTEGLLYTCGSTFKGIEVDGRCQPNEDQSVLTLFERVFVHENLTCDDPVEVPYYSSDRPCLY